MLFIYLLGQRDDENIYLLFININWNQVWSIQNLEYSTIQNLTTALFNFITYREEFFFSNFSYFLQRKCCISVVVVALSLKKRPPCSFIRLSQSKSWIKVVKNFIPLWHDMNVTLFPVNYIPYESLIAHIFFKQHLAEQRRWINNKYPIALTVHWS